MTFDEFIQRFSSEDRCRDYLYKVRFPEGFACPKCGNRKAWRVGKTLYECARCGRQTSVIAGTIFQDTRRPLRTWLAAIWRVTTQKNGASAQGLQQVLGHKSYKTAWTWLHKIRKATVFSGREKLSGTVEVDETYLGGKGTGGKRGRGTENKELVIVAVEAKGKKIGRTRMKLIDDTSGPSLRLFITGNIEKGSGLITDGWPGYSGIEKEGYARTIHKQSKAGEEDELLPHVHMVISLLRRWFLGTHQGAVSRKHLPAYLDEYVFRFNRRKSANRGLLFYRLLENAMNTSPITLEELLN
jgi:transposase-like protein/ribosomal protein L37AE/L43A